MDVPGRDLGSGIRAAKDICGVFSLRSLSRASALCVDLLVYCSLLRVSMLNPAHCASAAIVIVSSFYSFPNSITHFFLSGVTW
jgi:hypothetical protein